MSSEVTKKTLHVLEGVVVSDARDKTRKVRVKWSRKDPMLEKIFRTHTDYQVHDAENVSKNGDTVQIQQCKPVSKTKHWALLGVVEK